MDLSKDSSCPEGNLCLLFCVLESIFIFQYFYLIICKVSKKKVCFLRPNCAAIGSTNGKPIRAECTNVHALFYIFSITKYSESSSSNVRSIYIYGSIHAALKRRGMICSELEKYHDFSGTPLIYLYSSFCIHDLWCEFLLICRRECGYAQEREIEK